MMSRIREHSVGLSLWFIFALLPSALAFYVPGVTPKAYHDNDRVPLYYNKISSSITRLPYVYGTLPFVCPPRTDAKEPWLNIGEVLRGDRSMESNIELVVGKDVSCVELCTVQISTEAAMEMIALINSSYHVEWIVDNLPGGRIFVSSDEQDNVALPYFELGGRASDAPQSDAWDGQPTIWGIIFVNNHFDINMLYQVSSRDPKDKYIVGFEVYPASYSSPSQCMSKSNTGRQKYVNSKMGEIVYTYSVTWRESNNITWATRWNRYLQGSAPKIHWYSITNSLIITMFLTGMVAMIILRTLKRDISSYNTNDDIEATDEDDSTGWKLVHGDVFRPPKRANLFAALIGAGVQCLIMVATTLLLSLFGFLNPSYRGGLISYGLAIYVLAGFFAGYQSSRIYKVLKGQSLLRNAILTATLIPSILFVIVFVLNLFVWGQQSSAAIPFGTFFALFGLWFGVSTPLVLAGAIFGGRRKMIEHPVRTNQIPRQIPDQPWYLKLHMSMAIGGLMPFAVIFIELFFIFKSIWSDQYYYMFGFLGLVTLILVITTVEITIVIIYFSLCSEDYRWWWRSFAISAASSFYLFAYSAFYYLSRQHGSGFVSAVVYFGQSLMICIVYGLSTGTLGFLATYLFVRKIYGAIKVD